MKPQTNKNEMTTVEIILQLNKEGRYRDVHWEFLEDEGLEDKFREYMRHRVGIWTETYGDGED